jgi:hypothetical protein
MVAAKLSGRGDKPKSRVGRVGFRGKKYLTAALAAISDGLSMCAEALGLGRSIFRITRRDWELEGQWTESTRSRCRFEVRIVHLNDVRIEDFIKELFT